MIRKKKSKILVASLQHFTLISHIIRYMLLVLGWIRAVLILHYIDSSWCWKQSSETVFHIDLTASHDFVTCHPWHDFPIPSHPKGDHARHFSTVKLSCSSNQFEMTWALWHATLATRGWTCGHNRMVRSNTKAPKVCQENISHAITPSSPDHGSMVWCWCEMLTIYHPKQATQVETYQTRESSLIQFLWAHEASCSNCFSRLSWPCLPV